MFQKIKQFLQKHSLILSALCLVIIIAGMISTQKGIEEEYYDNQVTMKRVIKNIFDSDTIEYFYPNGFLYKREIWNDYDDNPKSYNLGIIPAEHSHADTTIFYGKENFVAVETCNMIENRLKVEADISKYHSPYRIYDCIKKEMNGGFYKSIFNYIISTYKNELIPVFDINLKDSAYADGSCTKYSYYNARGNLSEVIYQPHGHFDEHRMVDYDEDEIVEKMLYLDGVYIKTECYKNRFFANTEDREFSDENSHCLSNNRNPAIDLKK